MKSLQYGKMVLWYLHLLLDNPSENYVGLPDGDTVSPLTGDPLEQMSIRLLSL